VDLGQAGVEHALWRHHAKPFFEDKQQHGEAKRRNTLQKMLKNRSIKPPAKGLAPASPPVFERYGHSFLKKCPPCWPVSGLAALSSPPSQTLVQGAQWHAGEK
jgi:hypothetical protein